jgi:hypothetical protein
MLVLSFLLLGHAASASNITIDFNGISGGDGSPFMIYMESGFTVSPVTNQWLVGQSGGNPGPFIYFVAQPSDMITATIQVTDGGAPFKFDSIDLYSSITPIPYTFVGLLDGNVVFTVDGTVPNTFGNFATVLNPDANLTIDTLDVSLTNSPGPCCSNPMGLDNIVLTTAANTPEPASLALVLTGVGGLGFSRWRRNFR